MVTEIYNKIYNEQLKTATLIGLISIPFTVPPSVISRTENILYIGGNIEGWPLLISGMFVGYLYNTRSIDILRAGIQTGLSGSVGVLLIYLYNILTIILQEGLALSIVAVILTPAAIALGIILSVLVSVFGALIGDQLADKLTHA